MAADYTEDFIPIANSMKSEGLSDIAINTFRYYYQELRDGNTGLIEGCGISSVDSLPDLQKLEDYSAKGKEALSSTVMIKLNGGLGTSMGLDKAKSLLPAKDGLSFIDIIVRQVEYLRRQYDCAFPLIFMNSFRTEEDTLEALNMHEGFINGQLGVPLSFIQNKVPKLRTDNFTAVRWLADPSMEWCPPGHGDLYTALVQTNLLKSLIQKGYRYAFVSNADNLGAVIDEQLLGYFANSGAPFLMEVADRTEADKKGGHLAATMSGGLLLRESAQCPSDEIEDFQNVEKFKYFNTNSLWFDLHALQQTLEANDYILKLPLIRNSKTVDPTDSSSPTVYQLETAMGSAIALFEGAKAIRVPRTRFAPVKKTDDLVVLWSDVYELDERGRVLKSPKRTKGDIAVFLDNNYYKTITEFEARFPNGVPSLIECSRMVVEGDVLFGKDVKVIGEGTIKNQSNEQRKVADGTIISSDFEV